jgi:hypothetical protein
MNGELVRSAREYYDRHHGDAAAPALSLEYRQQLVERGALRISQPHAARKWTHPHPSRVVLSDQARDQVLALHAAKAPLRDIARAIGYSISTAHRIVTQLLAERATCATHSSADGVRGDRHQPARDGCGLAAASPQTNAAGAGLGHTAGLGALS